MGKSEVSITQRTQYEAFTENNIVYFKLMFIFFKEKQSILVYVANFFNLFVMASMWLLLILFVCIGENTAFSETMSYINYYGVGCGKYIAILYNRKQLHRTLMKLKALSPTVETVELYNLQGHLKIYKLIELFLFSFYKYIIIFFNVVPLLQSIYILVRTGEFGFVMSILQYDVFNIHRTYPGYIFHNIFTAYSSFIVGLNIVGNDLCLFSLVQQLCLHLDLLGKRIMVLDPSKEESARDIKNIIKHHGEVVKIAKDLDHIFTPSIAFSLMSSSFILCFNMAQILNDARLIFIVKCFLLLMYEMKQVFFTCYFADRLITASENIFNVIYAHHWYEGSAEYKRLVLFMLTSTRKAITLNVGGVWRLSFVTLQQVFSYAYQMFAVMKQAP